MEFRCNAAYPPFDPALTWNPNCLSIPLWPNTTFSRRRIGRAQGNLAMGTRGSSDVAQGYAVRLMQHLVVPTFVLNPRRRVVIWNRACETPARRRRPKQSA